jgi:sodium/hydrogen exchanger 8
MNNSMPSEEGISAYFVLFSALLAIVLVLSKILHDQPILNSFLPESGMILLVGMATGFVINLFVDVRVVEPANDASNNDNDEFVVQSLLSFSPVVFMIVLLPPIIFNSGYHLRKELFFRHFVPILLFSVVGTLISSLSITFLLGILKAFDLFGDFAPSK